MICDVLPTLESFSHAVDAYTQRIEPERLGAEELLTQLERKRQLINRLELDFARDAAALDPAIDAELGISMEANAYSWIRDHCRMTSYTVLTALRVGRLAFRLTASASALREGRIGYAHLGLLAETADLLDGSPTATLGFDEAKLLRKAENLSVQRFRTECRHFRHRADREAFLADQVHDEDCRRLTLRSLGEGSLELSGYLDPESGAVLRTALEPLARKAGADDSRDADQRHADALVELCTRALDSGAIPQRASQRTHLQVTATLDTLLDRVGAPAGEVEFGGLVAGVTVQRLACDATISRVLLDAESAVVDVGRSVRVVPGATRRALNARDGGCRWPGCTRTASWTAAHHVVHWTHGGRTDLANLVLLCARHHWLVHEGGWRLTLGGDGALVVSPGHTVARPPVPALTE